MLQSRMVDASYICTYRGSSVRISPTPIRQRPGRSGSRAEGGPDEIHQQSGSRGAGGGQFRRDKPTSVPARVGGGRIYKDAYAQRRVSQKDIPTGIEGQYRTDGQSNIEQTYRTTDNIRVVKRRKGRGKRNENRWRRKTENKLNVAKESCVSCRCDGLGGKNQTWRGGRRIGRRMLQNDIPPDMVGLCRTDRHTNIGQTNGKTDGIRVSRRRKRLGVSKMLKISSM